MQGDIVLLCIGRLDGMIETHWNPSVGGLIGK